MWNKWFHWLLEATNKLRITKLFGHSDNVAPEARLTYELIHGLLAPLHGDGVEHYCGGQLALASLSGGLGGGVLQKRKITFDYHKTIQK